MTSVMWPLQEVIFALLAVNARFGADTVELIRVIG